MKFEELMNIINGEVSKVMKEPLKEPMVDKKNEIKRKNLTALQSEAEIDEVLFIQDDIKTLDKQEKNKPKKL